MNNDQVTPQVPPTVPTDNEKELADAALRETGIITGAPAEQVTSDSSVSESPVPSASESATDNTYDSNGIVPPSPQVNENTASTDTVVETPAPTTTTPAVEIPVNDNTIVASEETAAPVINGSSEGTSTDSSPVTQVEDTPLTPSLEAQPAPTVIGSSPTTGQTPVQPEGLVARFLSIFKK